MKTSRLEAFSDGVLAIIITIMVLELRVPAEHDLAALFGTTGPGLLTYLLSFVYVGIYWNNHHHMFHLVQRVSGGLLWANLALLFCLSLFPFTTAWVDESHYARIPVVVYGLNLLAAALAYVVLQAVAVRLEGPDGVLREAVGADLKGKISMVILLAGIGSALVSPWIALACYAVVAIIWVVPDRRIDRLVRRGESVVPTR